MGILRAGHRCYVMFVVLCLCSRGFMTCSESSGTPPTSPLFTAFKFLLLFPLLSLSSLLQGIHISVSQYKLVD